MEGALSRMRTLPWRGMLALFGGFLITVSFWSFRFFGYKIMMLWVVWCLIEILSFSCRWAPSIHSAIWWPTWHLIWGGKNMLSNQNGCGRFLFVLKTLPKAQRTRGLSSYHEITVHSSQILNILQYQNIQPNISSKILTKLQLQNLSWTSTSKSWPKCSKLSFMTKPQLPICNKLLPTRSSSSTSPTVTTSTSCELASLLSQLVTSIASDRTRVR